MEEWNKRVDRCCENIQACLKEGERSRLGQHNRRHDRSNSSALSTTLLASKYDTASEQAGLTKHEPWARRTLSTERLSPASAEESWRPSASSTIDDFSKKQQKQLYSSSGVSSLPSSEAVSTRTRDISDTSLQAGIGSEGLSTPDYKETMAAQCRPSPRTGSTSAYSGASGRAWSDYGKTDSWKTSYRSREPTAPESKYRSVVQDFSTASQPCSPKGKLPPASKSAGLELRSSAYRSDLGKEPMTSTMPASAVETRTSMPWKSEHESFKREVVSKQTVGEGKAYIPRYKSVGDLTSLSKSMNSESRFSTLKDGLEEAGSEIRFRQRSDAHDVEKGYPSSGKLLGAEGKLSMHHFEKDSHRLQKTQGAKATAHGRMDFETFQREVLSAALKSARSESRLSSYEGTDRVEQEMMARAEAAGPPYISSKNNVLDPDSSHLSVFAETEVRPSKSLCSQTNKLDEFASRSSINQSSGYESGDRGLLSSSKSTTCGKFDSDVAVTPSKSATSQIKLSAHHYDHDTVACPPRTTYGLSERSAPVKSVVTKTFSLHPDEDDDCPPRTRAVTSAYKQAQGDLRTSSSRLSFSDATRPAMAEGIKADQGTKRARVLAVRTGRTASTTVSSAGDSLRARAHSRTRSSPSLAGKEETVSAFRQVERQRSRETNIDDEDDDLHSIITCASKNRKFEDFLYEMHIREQMEDAVVEKRLKNVRTSTQEQYKEASPSEIGGHKRSSTVPLDSPLLSRLDEDSSDRSFLSSPASTPRMSMLRRPMDMSARAFPSQKLSEVSAASYSQRTSDSSRKFASQKSVEASLYALNQRIAESSDLLSSQRGGASVSSLSQRPTETFHASITGRRPENISAFSHQKPLVSPSASPSNRTVSGTNTSLYGKPFDTSSSILFGTHTESIHTSPTKSLTESLYSHLGPSNEIMEMLDRRRKSIELDMMHHRLSSCCSTPLESPKSRDRPVAQAQAQQAPTHAPTQAPTQAPAEVRPLSGDAGPDVIKKEETIASPPRPSTSRSEPQRRPKSKAKSEGSPGKSRKSHRFWRKSPPWKRSPEPYLFPYGTYIKDGQPVMPNEEQPLDKRPSRARRSRRRLREIWQACRRFVTFFFK